MGSGYESFVPGERHSWLERRYRGFVCAGRCRKMSALCSGRDKVPAPFETGDNQRPERTGSGVRKPPPESSVPGENLIWGSRRNQLRRGHGSPPVLSEVPYELRAAAHSKECKRSPQQFIPAGFPLCDQPPTGTDDSDRPLTTPDMVRSGRVLHSQLNHIAYFPAILYTCSSTGGGKHAVFSFRAGHKNSRRIFT